MVFGSVEGVLQWRNVMFVSCADVLRGARC